MPFSHPITEHRFNNKYYVILWTLSLLLDRFDNEEQLCAVQCIWWLLSITQFTEIVISYRHYTIFPSDYVINGVVTSLFSSHGDIIPEDDIPELSLEAEVNSESPKDRYSGCPSRTKNLPTESSGSFIIQTQRGKGFNSRKIKQKELQKPYPGRSYT